jgi:fructoselysine-6-P-deglycase FrlB-like protein
MSGRIDGNRFATVLSIPSSHFFQYRQMTQNETLSVRLLVSRTRKSNETVNMASAMNVQR